MGVTSEILGNSGSPHAIEYNGKTYKVRLIDQSVQSAFEKRLYEKDCAGVRLQREQGLLDAAEYAASLKGLAAAYRNGDYEMLSPAGLKILTSVPGVKLLLSLLIGCPESELIPLVLAKKTELVNLVGLIIQESFPGMDMQASEQSESPPAPPTGGGDPNAPTAA